MRDFIGWLLIKAGMAVLRPGTKEMVRKIIMYNVPGGLTEAEKAEVRSSKAAWLDRL